jgi:hypothetical protein
MSSQALLEDSLPPYRRSQSFAIHRHSAYVKKQKLHDVGNTISFSSSFAIGDSSTLQTELVASPRPQAASPAFSFATPAQPPTVDGVITSPHFKIKRFCHCHHQHDPDS